MRRGLMAWSQQEVPAGLLESRIARLVSGMRSQGLACLLAYTDIARPAAVSALTHFIPYWSNGVLLVTPSAEVRLVATLSRRVAGWIRSTSRLDGLINTIDLGGGLVDQLRELGAGTARVGVVELNSFPTSVVAAVRNGHPSIELRDATELLVSALAVKELCPRSAQERCMHIARSALEVGALAAHCGDANAVVAAADGMARREGAEEILVAVAPDAARDPRLRRIEGTTPLGETYLFQVSIAYKGHWMRLGRTLNTAGPDPWISEADALFERAAGEIASGESPHRALHAVLSNLSNSRLDSWRVEAAHGGLALAVVAGSPPFTSGKPATYGPLTLTARLRREESWWFGATPIVLEHTNSRSASPQAV